jgi:LPXTG-site transpeptidase (sortase) family protein
MENQKNASGSAWKLFLGTFASSFLLIFGIGLMLLIFFPNMASALVPAPAIQPQLPLAGDATPTPSPTPTPSMVPLALYPPLSEPTDVAAGDWNRIPSLAVNVPLAMAKTMEDKDVIAALKDGAALYPNGILPGHLGNTFIAGHSSGFLGLQGKYRFAFIHIDQLKPGNVINLDFNGARYTYEVTGSDVVKPTSDFRVTSDRPLNTLTLMACSPIWTATNRLLVNAQLTNITQLTTVQK